MVQKGSITIEAAIGIVATMTMVLSIMMFLRVVYVHSVVQHALTQTVNEMATYSYFYSLIGVDTINNALDEKGQTGNVNVSDAIDQTSTFLEAVSGGDWQGATEQLPDFDVKEVLLAMKDAAIGEVYASGKTVLLNQVTKPLLKTYLPQDLKVFAEKNGIVIEAKDGFFLNLQESSYFQNPKDEIHIVAVYRIKLPLPIPILDEITMVQSAKARAWLEH